MPAGVLDARESQPGVVGGAHGGTLFLDEISALSHKGQVALLRFLRTAIIGRWVRAAMSRPTCG